MNNEAEEDDVMVLGEQPNSGTIIELVRQLENNRRINISSVQADNRMLELLGLGEQLDSDTIAELVWHLRDRRRIGISSVLTNERLLELLGHPVESAIRPKDERNRPKVLRDGRLSEKVTQGA